MKNWIFVMAIAAALAITGCTEPSITNTGRNAVQELLLSHAVERGLDQMDFRPLNGKKVALDYVYLAPQTYKEYFQACAETALYTSGATVVAKAEEADYIVRLYVGALATESTQWNIGTPTLPVPVPDTTLSIAIPELSLLKRITRNGVARFSALVLDAKTKKPFLVYREVNAVSQYNNWIVFFFIPFHSCDMTTGEVGKLNYHMF
ncbi:MAG: hypothetical protein IKC77_05340 [Lentisphaeria bacterium]|nr:hypothetical protein [Lentisphaeria bacterium]